MSDPRIYPQVARWGPHRQAPRLSSNDPLDLPSAPRVSGYDRATVILARIVLIVFVAAIMLGTISISVRACRVHILNGTAGNACLLTALIDPWQYEIGLPELF